MGKIAYVMAPYSTNRWDRKADFPVDIALVTGEHTAGMIGVSNINRKDIYIMDNYAANTWSFLTSAPFPIEGISGRNSTGILIYFKDPTSGKATRVAYMSDYTAKNWTVVSAPAPFEIEGITGDNSDGPVVFGGGNSDSVAYLSNYGSPSWTTLTNNAPFPLGGISGNNRDGVVGFEKNSGNGRVAECSNYLSSKWVTSVRLNEEIYFIAGGPHSGVNTPIVLSGPGAKHFYAYNGAAWTQLADVPSTVTNVIGFSGNFGDGPILVGG